MSQLIKLSITNRGTFPNADALKGGPTVYGFDVEDIVSPIRRNSNLSRTYFTARTIKDGANNNLNGAKIDYMATDPLVTIAAQSPKLLLLTVISRRGVASNESYIFVSSKISENLAPVNGGTKFFYIEDGDPLPVEYIVSQSVSTIVSASTAGSIYIQDTGTNMPAEPKLNFVGFTVEDNPGNGSTDVINVKEVTYNELSTLISANSLPVGAKYLITDRADAGIEVIAVSSNSLSINADGFFLNPDFQDVGFYSGTPLTKQNNLGVWTVGVEATALEGDIVFWYGVMYQVVNSIAFAGTSPDVTPDAYVPLIKNINNGYILECDKIHYDVLADLIFYRADKRENIAQNNGAVPLFQWGNNTVYGNKMVAGYYDCINNKGGISGNVVLRGSVSSDNSNLGTISDSTFEAYNGGIIANFNSGKDIRGSSIVTYAQITFDPTIATTNGNINRKYSTFESTLNMSDPAIYDLASTTLTIPSEKNYIGLFTLINNSGRTITKIVHSPAQKRFAFKCNNGITENFNHTSIAGPPAANSLVSDAAASNAIVGRTNGADQIEYEKSGNLNIRTNIVKLA